MNPLVPLEFAIPLLLAFAGLLLRGMKRARGTLEPPWFAVSIGLRLATLAAMGVLVLNPGRYAPRREARAETAHVLVDRSASMATIDRPDAPSRFDRALALARALPSDADGLDIQYAAFGETLEPAASLDALESNPSPDATTTRIETAVEQLVRSARADPRPTRGALLLSDGISLEEPGRAEAVALAARAGGMPLHARVVGNEPRAPDAILEASRSLYTVTAGADRPLRGRVHSRHLPPSRATLRLVDAEGTTLDRVELDLPENDTVSFEVRTGELDKGLHPLELILDPVEGDTRPDNNRHTVYVDAVDLSLDILMLEGVPHWDSKFLAQWLRGRHGVRLTTLHRISDNRWFRVDPEQDAPENAGEGLLPGEENEFRAYDVILVGRGLDYLATSRTTSALHAFVRDHGGVLIFTRGRPVTTPHAGLESLVPVRWLPETSSERRARPAPAGSRIGLFGDLLPGDEDPVWDDLPPLRGLRRMRLTDGLARVLMRAGRGDDSPWPVLVGHRLGHGRVLLFNGEGMWHWDFRSHLERRDKWYGQFWTQLMLWVVRSSLFQPGAETSVEWTPVPAQPGKPVDFRVRHRLGEDLAPLAPRLRLAPMNGDPVILPVRAEETGSGSAQWSRARPGLYAVAVETVDTPRPAPLRYLHIPAPPAERDDLAPRENPLRTLVDTSGGRWLERDEDVADLFAETEPVLIETDTEAVWTPHWTRAWILCMLVALPAADWALRRRKGLV